MFPVSGAETSCLQLQTQTDLSSAGQEEERATAEKKSEEVLQEGELYGGVLSEETPKENKPDPPPEGPCLSLFFCFTGDSQHLYVLSSSSRVSSSSSSYEGSLQLQCRCSGWRKACEDDVGGASRVENTLVKNKSTILRVPKRQAPRTKQTWASCAHEKQSGVHEIFSELVGVPRYLAIHPWLFSWRQTLGGA